MKGYWKRAHLHEGSQGEYGAGELLLRQVSQEICLVLHCIWRHGEPDLAARVPPRTPHQPCIVPRAYPVKLPAKMSLQVLVESPKLYPTVHHHTSVTCRAKGSSATKHACASSKYKRQLACSTSRRKAAVPGRLKQPARLHMWHLTIKIHDRTLKRHLELQRMSGLGVRPALISLRQCETTRCQYCSVRGTTSNGTPASRHTCTVCFRHAIRRTA